MNYKLARRISLPIILFFSGCANYGSADFLAYYNSFSSQKQQSEAILDKLSHAERRVVEIYSPTSALDFDPNRAAYYIVTVDPPITRSIRLTVRSIDSYNSALLALANGETSDAYVAKVGVAISDTAAAIAATRVAIGGPPQIKSAENLVTSVGTQLAFSLPGLQKAAQLRGQLAFRTLIRDTHPSVKHSLQLLIDGTPAMFEVLAVAKARTGGRPGDPYRPEDLEALKAIQIELASWVLSLNASLTALEAAVDAVEKKTSPNMATLTATTSEMKILAEQLKAARILTENKGGR